MLVIPAIDLLGGRTVRLLRGSYDEVTRYEADPVDVARGFADAGARRIHVVDLDAARGQGHNSDVLRAMFAAVEVDVEVGGGVRSAEAVEGLLGAGAAFVVVGTVAAERPAEVRAWAHQWPGKIYIGVDARDGDVATHGWERSVGQPVAELRGDFEDAAVAGFIFTDINRDGALGGAAIGALADVVASTSHPVILSGGVTAAADLSAARAAGAHGAIIGRALYEGRMTIEEAIAAGD
ncbi:MAG: 1-(5-phosphoribosyl)-5-[(5-phosphoribosylamino) methylideneamino]imidazole-4-carboxamide isomerase [Candidatus Dormibacteria bacterium]